MKKFIFLAFYLVSLQGFACGGGDYEDGFDFYNLFNQENISDENYYPFLRDDYNTFYGDDYYYDSENKSYFNGNIKLWKEILNKYSEQEIANIVYKNKQSDWNNNLSNLEKSAKKYLDFAENCSKKFEQRGQYLSWDYEEIIKNEHSENNIVEEATELLNGEKNEQLKMRYYYQIIRAFHYRKDWQDAVDFYETTIENKYPKNEIYYYIMDQVAGCYYSLENYEKSAYLFTKVISNSADRKKSAFSSFNLCINKGAEGKSYFEGIEDEKDLLLIQNLTSFSEDISSLEKFRNLDANDARIELLFMRHLNNIERVLLPKLPGLTGEDQSSNKEQDAINKLIRFSNLQKNDSQVSHNDFWEMANSYLYFLNNEIATATSTLQNVKTYKEQKNALEAIYTVSSWNTITAENEVELSTILKKLEVENNQPEVLHYVKDIAAHKYYKNGEVAKSFLVHNDHHDLKNINSILLLDALIEFKQKTTKNVLETRFDKRIDLGYLYKQKGIYYLLEAKPTLALDAFKKNKTATEELISANVFSNNIKECFDCNESDIMTDKVYEADLFSFIKSQFTRKELAEYLIQLEKLTQDEKQWKVKLANYLLGNYYFNISNTGYFRGVLAENSNCCDYNYIDYHSYNEHVDVNEKIKNLEGYNLFDVNYFTSYYFNLSSKAANYYEKVIENSTDKELNARTLYMIAKCDLNSFYNNDGAVEMQITLSKYTTIDLPSYDQSFKFLKKDYSDTEFYNMIRGECMYFDAYVNM